VHKGTLRKPDTNPGFVLLQNSRDIISPKSCGNDTPHDLGYRALEKKMTNGFNIITEIAGRITNPMPLYHIIFGKNGFFFQ